VYKTKLNTKKKNGLERIGIKTTEIIEQLKKHLLTQEDLNGNFIKIETVFLLRAAFGVPFVSAQQIILYYQF